jgi:hypothetical protein
VPKGMCGFQNKENRKHKGKTKKEGKTLREMYKFNKQNKARNRRRNVVNEKQTRNDSRRYKYIT